MIKSTFVFFMGLVFAFFLQSSAFADDCGVPCTPVEGITSAPITVGEVMADGEPIARRLDDLRAAGQADAAGLAALEAEVGDIQTAIATLQAATGAGATKAFVEELKVALETRINDTVSRLALLELAGVETNKKIQNHEARLVILEKTPEHRPWQLHVGAGAKAVARNGLNIVNRATGEVFVALPQAEGMATLAVGGFFLPEGIPFVAGLVGTGQFGFDAGGGGSLAAHVGGRIGPMELTGVIGEEVWHVPNRGSPEWLPVATVTSWRPLFGARLAALHRFPSGQGLGVELSGSLLPLPMEGQLGAGIFVRF